MAWGSFVASKALRNEPSARAARCRALVLGAGGFIGWHLVKRLRDEGFYVIGVDQKWPEFAPTVAHEFYIADLREPLNADDVMRRFVFTSDGAAATHVYQLAADMGGMGFIHGNELDCLSNSARINQSVADAARILKPSHLFFSSSVCVYRDMAHGEPELTEADAYPALPDNEYGWEKLYAERLYSQLGEDTGINVQIARFQNTYGENGTWCGGREKAPAAICRKVAELPDEGGVIDVWGDGSAVRSYTYVDDLVDGIRLIMDRGDSQPYNIGCPVYIDVNELVRTVGDVAGKRVEVRHIDGPVGVQSRNFSNARIETLGWHSYYSPHDGLSRLYPWVAEQVANRHAVADVPPWEDAPTTNEV